MKIQPTCPANWVNNTFVTNKPAFVPSDKVSQAANFYDYATTNWDKGYLAKALAIDPVAAKWIKKALFESVILGLFIAFIARGVRIVPLGNGRAVAATAA